MKRGDTSLCLDDGTEREPLGGMQRQRAPPLWSLCLFTRKITETGAYRYPRMSELYLQAQEQNCTFDVSISWSFLYPLLYDYY